MEPGKIADLVVLDRDPTLDIRNAEAIAVVKQGGKLYAGDTLDRLWPVARGFGHPWYRDDHPPLPVDDRTTLLADHHRPGDGAGTGSAYPRAAVDRHDQQAHV